jgi:hypothetical protein
VSGFDLEAYTRSVRAGPCFICALVAGEPAYNQTAWIFVFQMLDQARHAGRE